MWPGYSADVKHLNDGVFLNLDTATKFISQINIFDEIKDFKKQGYSNAEIVDWYVPKDPNRKRVVVITLFNSKIYQPDGLLFNQTPSTIKFNWE
jgi:hypothetical protein